MEYNVNPLIVHIIINLFTIFVIALLLLINKITRNEK